MSKTVLVAGGAGYIGSHACLALKQAGYTPVVFDNFSNGHKAFVQWGPFVEGDIRSRVDLDAAFDTYNPVGVMHFAGLIEVGESMKEPLSFHENNVTGAINLIAAAKEAEVQAFVFSSTCATYGEPHDVPMDETHIQEPLNPYGRSKLIIEQVLNDLRELSGFPSVALRYFNAAGADPEARIGEWHEPETHIIPLAFDTALGLRKGFQINGTDYETRDGTCVRDYIHVCDIAAAHVKALNYLLCGAKGGAFNLGTGDGTTIKELLDVIHKVTRRPFPVTEGPRRSGDSAMLVADNAKAFEVLGWRPEYSLENIVADAWRWHRNLRQSS
ncbi:UDP-glucose 4-epimerase GalE [Ponticaulis sp.]|uniref:UDP-glucose 4-epimerase GalE n=1 Tax=Ponticaulis sp. TaxID=2020902 RepID=UPI002629B313|nr:UDP-glucose 4-epimerase GalE [Ponticaulis sp.]MDF1679092.1 UDP-glucose 4-epimerase GalE [Ponticaulis sp.]